MVAIDYICDVGRSQPVCPSKKGDHGQWVKEIMDYIGARVHTLWDIHTGVLSQLLLEQGPRVVKGKVVILNVCCSFCTDHRRVLVSCVDVRDF